jgi:uncharacterized protein (TIGR02391 family)
MIDLFVTISRLLRVLKKMANDAKVCLENEDEGGAKIINNYMGSEYKNLHRIWSENFQEQELGYLLRHIRFGMMQDYQDIINHDIPQIEEKIEEYLLANRNLRQILGFENLLHPIIYTHAYEHFRNGHFREAVLNGVVAIFDLVRERTGLDLDGDALVTQTFSLNNPKLIFSEINSSSGKNDQLGFMQILQGVYKGIRNPKSHSLVHDLNEEKAAQYLIFASLLARRVSESIEA